MTAVRAESPIGRVTTVEELDAWIAGAQSRGATRFEVWQKTRGNEQRRLLVTDEQFESWTASDEIFAIIERDRRQLGHGVVSYAVFAFRGDEPSAAERVFVSQPTSAVAAQIVGSDGAGPPMPLLAMQSMLMTVQHMTQQSFGALQRENDQQRRSNEALMRSSHGHFETFAKGYERTFTDLQKRLEEALARAAEWHAKFDALELELKAERDRFKALQESKDVERAEIARKEKLQDIAREQLQLLAPIVMSKMGKAPMTGPLGSVAMKRLVDSLTTEQMHAMIAPLKPPQQALVMEIVTAYRNAGATAATEKASPATPASPSSNNGANDEPLARDFARLIEILSDPEKNRRFESWLEREKSETHEASAPTPGNDTKPAKSPKGKP